MKVLLISVALIIGQTNPLQNKQVVHLLAHSGAILASFGGKQLELVEAPTIVYLPMTPPKLDSQGNPWEVDIRNPGLGAITVVGKGQFSLRINAGQTACVFSNGTSYSEHAFLNGTMK